MTRGGDIAEPLGCRRRFSPVTPGRNWIEPRIKRTSSHVSGSIRMQVIETTKTPHLFTVAQYMALEIEDRTELLGGVIYDVSPKNEPHILAVRKLNKALTRGLGDEYAVRIQDPIAVSGWEGKDAPEIDVAVVAERIYTITPSSSDAFAFIEVSDTTYGRNHGDRKYKIPLYVSAGVSSWIVNIPLRQVEFYGSVEDLKLEHGRVFKESETIDVLGIAIPVADLFGR
jgi:hypothetical protein